MIVMPGSWKWIDSAPLEVADKQHNASLVYLWFTSAGWTLNAIAGMLGNMDAESTINPTRWEDDVEPPPDRYNVGYGLVQWTPYTKLSVWATDNGLGWKNHEAGNTECKRIIYELENGLQYSPTVEYNLSFESYSISLEPPEYLGEAFYFNYEKSSSGDPGDRPKLARYWYDWLTFNKPVSGLPLIAAISKRKRRVWGSV